MAEHKASVVEPIGASVKISTARKLEGKKWSLGTPSRACRHCGGAQWDSACTSKGDGKVTQAYQLALDEGDWGDYDEGAYEVLQDVYTVEGKDNGN